MKKLHLLLLFIAFAVVANAQDYLLPIDTVTNELKYQEIVEVKDTKANLFSKAKAWGVKTYKNYSKVVQLEDAESGKIILKGTQYVNDYIFDARVSYTVNIDCKDGKYRCTIDNIVFEKNITSWSEQDAWLFNALIKSAIKELEDPNLAKKDRESTQKLLLINKNITTNTNATMNTILTTLKEAMTSVDDF